jgi:hypothetical protein
MMRRPGRPQPQQRRLHSAELQHQLHLAQHRLQPPERRSAAGEVAAAVGAGINGTQECQSVATGPAGSAPGPVNTLASLAESKQNTNDKLKAYLTDIMWIIARSLVLR